VRVEQSIEIARPVEEVFAFVTDPDRLGEWQTSIVEVRRERAGTLQPGDRLREVQSALGRRVESTVEVVEYEPPRRFALHIIDGPIPFDGRWTFEPTPTGTRVHFVGEGALRGPIRLAEPLLTRALRRQFRRHHERLKRALEG